MTLILSGTDGLSDVDGSAATPAIRGTDANTGIFFGADIIGFAEGGAEVARFNADAQFVAAAGTASLPVITTTGDVNTGIFFPAADTIAFSEGGAEAMRIDSSGNVGIGTNSPSYKLQVNGIISSNDTVRVSDGTTVTIMSTAGGGEGIVGTSSNHALQFRTNNTERVRIDSSGNLLVGTTSTTGRIGSKATTTDSNGYGIYVEDSAAALMFYARNDGAISTGAKAASPYNNTTASAANMFVNSNGVLLRSTSSLKYKTNVQDAAHGLAELLSLRSVTYEGKTDGDKVFGGLIAEEVDEAGLTEFVQYAEDGSPDALAYGNMVSLCIKAIQEQQALITTLTDRITALETPTGTQA